MTRLSFDSTSAAGAMNICPPRWGLPVGFMLAGLGTSIADVLPQDVTLLSHVFVEQTTAGTLVPAAQAAGTALGELRRLSGLTWDQLARIFGVSRRALHFWASGKPMAPSHEEHLQRVLSVLRKIDRGAASANRAALLRVHRDGTIPIDLLAHRDYERALLLLGPGEGRPVLSPRLSREARAARAPRPPEELVGALEDRVHRESGALRLAKSVRVRVGR